MKTQNVYSSYWIFLTEAIYFFNTITTGSSECSGQLIEDICFEDMGNGSYVESAIMQSKVVRQMTIHTSDGKSYSLAAMGADYGYLFQDSVEFNGHIVVSNPTNICTTPINRASFKNKIVVAIEGGCFNEVKTATASMYGAKGLVLLGSRDRGFTIGLLAAHPCMPRGYIQRDMPVIATQHIAQSYFFRSHLNNIDTVTIASIGSKIGEDCGIARRNRLKAPYCHGHYYAHLCDRDIKKCVCREPLFTTVIVQGEQTCVLANGSDPDQFVLEERTCFGEVPPGSTGCNNASIFCSGFPSTVCYNDVCGCQIGFSLIGDIGDEHSTCVPTERATDTCLRADLHKTVEGNLANMEREYLENCMIQCHDNRSCYGIHVHRSLGSCVMYKKYDIIPDLDITEWLLYKSTQ